jgi:catechol 2,3-dioxygenase-like lactoylglutathione lyase family enzyme
MNATIGHIGINLSNSEDSFKFWKELLTHLGFSILDDGNHFDANDGRSYLCVSTTKGDYASEGFHRRRTGLNHIAFNLASPEQVDEFVVQFLAPRGIEPLYGGAKAYPEYTKDYYATYFEDPDRIKVEVAYDPASSDPSNSSPDSRC